MIWCETCETTVEIIIKATVKAIDVVLFYWDWDRGQLSPTQHSSTDRSHRGLSLWLPFLALCNPLVGRCALLEQPSMTGFHALVQSFLQKTLLLLLVRSS